jgi:hypothetical protein
MIKRLRYNALALNTVTLAQLPFSSQVSVIVHSPDSLERINISGE